MTVLQLLIKAAAEMAALKELLERVRAELPDLAEQINPILAALDENIDPTALAMLSVTILRELGQIATGHLDPRRHAGDAT